MTTDKSLPKPGTRVKCINNTDRPELNLNQVYVVVYDSDIGMFELPINYKRFQPADFRFVAIAMPGQPRGLYPFGIFEVV